MFLVDVLLNNVIINYFIYIQLNFQLHLMYYFLLQIGDSLRFKISHRPDRQQLVQQHILEGKYKTHNFPEGGVGEGLGLT